MSPYREPGGRAIPDPDPPRVVTIDKIDTTVRPHEWGRHRCPYCGGGRPLLLTFFRPDRGAGRFIALVNGKVEAWPVLKRTCAHCEAVWYVEPKELP